MYVELNQHSPHVVREKGNACITKEQDSDAKESLTSKDTQKISRGASEDPDRRHVACNLQSDTTRMNGKAQMIIDLSGELASVKVIGRCIYEAAPMSSRRLRRGTGTAHPVHGSKHLDGDGLETESGDGEHELERGEDAEVGNQARRNASVKR